MIYLEAKMVLSRKIKPRLIAVFCFVFMFLSTLMAEQIAFPGAEGFGKYATGGRGGEVIEVTNLNDGGEGSLRNAVVYPGPRTVVFRVSGTIELKSDLKINEDDITIAGQTAPGDGICLKGYPLIIKADNVIVRYIRSRLGDVNPGDNDALSATDGQNKNIIVDHCSFSWSIDETCSMYDNRNMTLQWCMITESLDDSHHEKGPHGYGGIWGGRGASFHHNFLAHHRSRNPRFNGARYHGDSDAEIVDFRNNVIYNWEGNSAYGGEDGNQNMVANYYKYGPATEDKYRIVKPSDSDGDWYITDNFVYGNPSITENNWAGGVQGEHSNPSKVKVDQPHPVEKVYTHDAEVAFEVVLADAGASQPNRDPVDSRLVEEARTGTATYGDNGIIDSQDDVGGWPELNSETPPTDEDHDGMADDWENDNGLNPSDPEDRNGDMDGDGYTNLEEYLNSLCMRDDYLVAPAELKAETISPSEINLSWLENALNEDGFKIERSESDTNNFVEIRTAGANDTSYSDAGLSPLTTYYYRIKAYNEDVNSVYSGIVQSTTLYSNGSPLKVSDPSPADSTEDINIGPILDWQEADGAESYDVYLGTSTEDLEFLDNVTESEYKAGILNEGTTYFWRVNAVNTSGKTEGPIWRFTTESVSRGLIAYYDFNSGAGRYAEDQTENSNLGHLENMDDNASWTDGKESTALTFDGSDDYIFIRHKDVYEIGVRSITISMWVKPSDVNSNSNWISKGNLADEGAGQGFALYTESDGNIVFKVGDGETESGIKTSATPFSGGDWVKVTAVRNRPEEKLLLYANEELLASIGDSTWSISNKDRIFIASNGQENYYEGYYYEGSMDNIRIYNYALDSADIGELYTNTTKIRQETLPENYTLDINNYPNPFNPATKITFVVPQRDKVSLAVYNLKGQEVATLVNNITRKAGKYSVIFDGSGLSSGIYISRLQIGNKFMTKKMMLIK